MEYFLPFLPALLALLGNRFQRRDKNNTGADDAVGRAFTQMGVPLSIALTNPDDRGLLRALKGSRDALDIAIRELEAEQASKVRSDA